MASRSAELRIAGFGSWMMGQNPYGPGILQVAANLIEKRVPVRTRPTILSIGFPLEELKKGVPDDILKLDTDYLVLQSASVGAAAGENECRRQPLANARLRSKLRLLTGLWAPIRSELLSLVEFLEGVDPLIPMINHLSAVMQIASACKSKGARAVVLSPFFSQHSTRRLTAYQSALRDLAKVQDIILVDRLDALTLNYKHSGMQNDDCLSKSQQIIGQLLAASIVSDAKVRFGPGEESRARIPNGNDELAL